MIKYLIMDVDGTLTDGKIYMGPQKECLKVFNIKDGLGIHELLPKAGIEPVIITGRISEITKTRCDELGIKFLFQGINDKLTVINKLKKDFSGDFSQFAYIGDDLNDLCCMKFIKNNGGIIACPADAALQVKEISDFICSKTGGDGAVREFIEWIIK